MMQTYLHPFTGEWVQLTTKAAQVLTLIKRGKMDLDWRAVETMHDEVLEAIAPRWHVAWLCAPENFDIIFGTSDPSAIKYLLYTYNNWPTPIANSYLFECWVHNMQRTHDFAAFDSRMCDLIQVLERATELKKAQHKTLMAMAKRLLAAQMRVASIRAKANRRKHG